MEKIIDPVPVELLKAELTPEKKLRNTNKGGNVIYIVDAHDSPNVMREIGRLREESFRQAGGSSGLEADIDEFDTMPDPYKQIVVWDLLKEHASYVTTDIEAGGIANAVEYCLGRIK